MQEGTATATAKSLSLTNAEPSQKPFKVTFQGEMPPDQLANLVNPSQAQPFNKIIDDDDDEFDDDEYEDEDEEYEDEEGDDEPATPDDARGVMQILGGSRPRGAMTTP